MDLVKALLISVVHGTLEFFPVSSSTHVLVLESWLGYRSEALELVLGCGTAVSVLLYYRKRVVDLLKGMVARKLLSWLYVLSLALGCIPIVLAYSFAYKGVKSYLLDHHWLIGVLMALSGLLVVSTRRASPGTSLVTPRRGILVGLAQMFALLQGVSRSGVTISSGRWLGINWESAVEFSFLLSVPLSVGGLAMGLDSFESGLVGTKVVWWHLAICGLLSCGIGYASLSLLHVLVKRGMFWLFGAYCVLAGIVGSIVCFLKG
ncbi:MAG: undecaprenyl-diphosphate phosphatase [Lentisphaerae bacterium]|jgi:undecaprenyl-diphosphatase|nr:undecaprenyl-diphosphate phosphatase [Lentisphaerota bacterium]